jgi:large subunit ribosomal protein LP2
MKFLAAYLLLVAGGKTDPSAEEITKLLGSVGVEGDKARLNSLLKGLQGKTIEEVSTFSL